MVVEKESVVCCCCDVGEALVTRVMVDETVDCTGSSAGNADDEEDDDVAGAPDSFVHSKNRVPDASTTATSTSSGSVVGAKAGGPALAIVLMT